MLRAQNVNAPTIIDQLRNLHRGPSLRCSKRAFLHRRISRRPPLGELRGAFRETLRRAQTSCPQIVFISFLRLLTRDKPPEDYILRPIHAKMEALQATMVLSKYVRGNGKRRIRKGGQRTGSKYRRRGIYHICSGTTIKRMLFSEKKLSFNFWTTWVCT